MKKSALILCILALTACGSRQAKAPLPAKTDAPAFCADSAFSYVKAQTDFGPRVPNTKAHKSCAKWLAAKMSSFGADTKVQEFTTTAFDGTRLECFNIIGRINPESPIRVIVCSHWDSRPWADNDDDPANRKKPVDGANDGASGVGVILEMARQFQSESPEIGVDCIFFDAEDWGPGDDFKGQHLETYWGLGTQYWARQSRSAGYKARYAVLLDMVGGRKAQFCREAYSSYFAKNVQDKVWSEAARLGYTSLFSPADGLYVTDDHYFINTIAKIPAIDIVPYMPNSTGSSFGPTWHTAQDNIENIDKATLEAVGKTLLSVIYKERR